MSEFSMKALDLYVKAQVCLFLLAVFVFTGLGIGYLFARKKK